MALLTRRQFVQTGVASAIGASALMSSRHAFSSPFGLPLGLELYSVREMLPQDYAGTLKKVAALGYREVEAAGFYHHSASEVKKAMTDAGLRCVSAHYPWAQIDGKSNTGIDGLDAIIAFHKELGAEFIICSSPGHKDPSSAGSHSMTMDDWRWNAENFNRVGEKVKAAGFRFGYHNHVAEFDTQDGVVPYDELVRLTKPDLVTFEMDCGWVTMGGGDPVTYLRKYPNRISMLHVKDFASGSVPKTPHPKSAELGRGMIDYRKIFAAAKKGEIKHFFVEQEEFDMPPLEALKVDADYMKSLTI